jgi:hypothetical protein
MNKLPLFALTWIGFLLLRTVVILLGLIIVPFMAFFYDKTSRLETSKVNGRLIRNWKYKFMYPWSNDEDGIEAGEELIGWPSTFRIIYWSAIRNPANNLRFIRALNLIIEPQNVRFTATKRPNNILGQRFESDITDLYTYDCDEFRFTSLTWCGLYSNLRVQFKMFGKIWRFWIGWKIYPHDSLGIDPSDYRVNGAGFATQFKRIYPRS